MSAVSYKSTILLGLKGVSINREYFPQIQNKNNVFVNEYLKKCSSINKKILRGTS